MDIVERWGKQTILLKQCMRGVIKQVPSLNQFNSRYLRGQYVESFFIHHKSSILIFGSNSRHAFIS